MGITFANNQWGSLLQITNQKCIRNVKRTIRKLKTSDMALLLIELYLVYTILLFWRYT